MFISDYLDDSEILKIVGEYGVKVETIAFIDWNRTKSDEEIIEHLKDIYETTDCIHGPFMELDFMTDDEEIRKKTYDEFSKYHDLCLALNCKGIVMHSSYTKKDDNYEAGLQRAITFWKEFLVEHTSVKYYAENFADSTPDFLIDLHDGVNMESLKLCIDVGHAHISSDIAISEWITKMGMRIGHAHIHNNNGTDDEHKDLANGTIDMKKVLDHLAEVLPREEWCIETGELRASLDWLRDNGYL